MYFMVFCLIALLIYSRLSAVVGRSGWQITWCIAFAYSVIIVKSSGRTLAILPRSNQPISMTPNTVSLLTHLSWPCGIAIDVLFSYYSKIFWTDRGYPPKIESANLDGSDHRVIVDSHLSWPCGIAIDYQNERLYWADMKGHIVETAKYDGLDRHIVRTFSGWYQFLYDYQKQYKFYESKLRYKQQIRSPASPVCRMTQN